MLRRILVCAAVASVFSSKVALAYMSVYCVTDVSTNFDCFASRDPNPNVAKQAAREQCTRHSRDCTPSQVIGTDGGSCVAIAALASIHASYAAASYATIGAARVIAYQTCEDRYHGTCHVMWSACESDIAAADTPASQSTQNTPSTIPPAPPPIPPPFIPSVQQLGITPITAGAFFIFLLLSTAVIVAYVKGRLPKSLPVYGDDIRCVFKRTQRLNWYGRVVFGVVATLVMTKDQLADVRKYWLGRVVAFDSLRRQRQNELARMHLQLAASAKSEAHDKKKFWSRRWAMFRTFLRRLFWVFAALFRLLFSFFFIRVNIAKLVRGTIVESKDLTLVLQAKQAIEETAMYLKEYLETANTFDGRGEVV
jgi:hypothetical protein